MSLTTASRESKSDRANCRLLIAVQHRDWRKNWAAEPGPLTAVYPLPIKMLANVTVKVTTFEHKSTAAKS